MSRNLWNNLKERMASRMEADEYRLWLEPLNLLKQEGSVLTVGCPNAFHQKWVRDRYLNTMIKMVRETNIENRINLEIITTNQSNGQAAGHYQMSLPRLNPFSPTLNQRYVFQRFIAGRSNELACAAAKALASGQHLFSNTLFLASDTGLGKSHLTQAVGHHVMANSPQTRVAYLTAEDFTNQMVSALRKNRIENFKERFRRECDLLLLEEVHFLCGKDKTQDELGYTIDALLDAGKRVVFTSSQPPFRLKKLKSGLESRLGSGVTVSIDPPDEATRVLILKAMAGEEGVLVPEEVLELLAQEVTGDVRRLQSALVGILAQSALTCRPMDLKLAMEVLGQISTRRKRVTIEDIRDTVAKIYGLEMSLFVGKCRRKNVTKPRNLAMFMCRKHTDASFAAIGKLFNRDHATVIYGVDKIDRELKRDPKLVQEMKHLEERLGLKN